MGVWMAQSHWSLSSKTMLCFALLCFALLCFALLCFLETGKAARVRRTLAEEADSPLGQQSLHRHVKALRHGAHQGAALLSGRRERRRRRRSPRRKPRRKPRRRLHRRLHRKRQPRHQRRPQRKGNAPRAFGDKAEGVSAVAAEGLVVLGGSLVQLELPPVESNWTHFDPIGVKN